MLEDSPCLMHGLWSNGRVGCNTAPSRLSALLGASGSLIDWSRIAIAATTWPSCSRQGRRRGAAVGGGGRGGGWRRPHHPQLTIGAGAGGATPSWSSGTHATAPAPVERVSLQLR